MFLLVTVVLVPVLTGVKTEMTPLTIEIALYMFGGCSDYYYASAIR
jgi:hypothetical protein